MNFKANNEAPSKQVKKCINEDNEFSAIITGIDFSEITFVYEDDCDVTSLNEIVDQTFEEGYLLEDLSYEIVGFNQKDQTINVRVTANAEKYLMIHED